MLTKPALVAMLLAALAGCSAVPPPVSDIPAAIVNASGPADHQKIADYFDGKARAYDAEAAQHELIARTYMNRTRGDSASMMSHCRALRDQFAAAAKEARALAHEHRQAANGGK